MYIFYEIAHICRLIRVPMYTPHTWTIKHRAFIISYPIPFYESLVYNSYNTEFIVL